MNAMAKNTIKTNFNDITVAKTATFGTEATITPTGNVNFASAVFKGPLVLSPASKKIVKIGEANFMMGGSLVTATMIIEKALTIAAGADINYNGKLIFGNNAVVLSTDATKAGSIGNTIINVSDDTVKANILVLDENASVTIGAAKTLEAQSFILQGAGGSNAFTLSSTDGVARLKAEKGDVKITGETDTVKATIEGITTDIEPAVLNVTGDLVFGADNSVGFGTLTALNGIDLQFNPTVSGLKTKRAVGSYSLIQLISSRINSGSTASGYLVTSAYSGVPGMVVGSIGTASELVGTMLAVGTVGTGYLLDSSVTSNMVLLYGSAGATGFAVTIGSAGVTSGPSQITADDRPLSLFDNIQ
jgi:hypothetical protein